ncbi:MAG: hypothetical protein ACLGI5_11470 [Thermoleophilia bacterium]
MEREPLEGVGAADEHLGRPVPLPAAALPLVRWVEVVASGPGAVQVEWNFDVSRPESPARLTLYAGVRPAPERGLPAAQEVGRYAYRQAPLAEAEPEFRPVQELAWEREGLHLRLTAQGPWVLTELVAIADSVI